MKLRILILAATTALAFSSAALAATPIDAKADAGGAGVFVAATLAPLGSFEYKVAPSYTRLSVVRRNAAVALRKGAITVDQAQTVQDKADVVRSLLDQSVKACAQNDKTGKCTKDGAGAERLLKQANAALEKL